MNPNIQYTFQSKGLEENQELLVVSFTGTEGVSRLYEFTITLRSASPDIDMNAVLKSTAFFTIHAGETRRNIHGCVREFEQLQQVGHVNPLEEETQYTIYRAVLVPRLWHLSLFRTNEVYISDLMNEKGTSVVDVIRMVMQECGFSHLDFEFRLKDKYKKWPYRCQWDETHLNYLMRLLEYEGIYFFFLQEEDYEKIIFCDHRMHQEKIEDPVVNYSPPQGMDIHTRGKNIHSLVCRTKRMPKTIVLQDYNYEKPSLDVTARAFVDEENGIGEVFSYGENFETPEEGGRLARIRAEGLYCEKEQFHGESMVPRLTAGYIFTLNGHYRDSFNLDYMVTEVTHEGHSPKFPQSETGFQQESAPGYVNTFTAIPEHVQFRPPCITPKSRFHGVINAVVDGELDGEYAELDDMGRYKILLPFDRETRRQPGNASWWFRKAEPHAGPDEGMHFPLRKHTEVLLSFVDGDPDRPIIQSAIANTATPNVVNSKNQKNNVIKTRSGNYLDMEDSGESRRIKMYSPEAKTYMHLGAPNHAGRGVVMLTEGIHRMEIGGGYHRTLMTEDKYEQLKQSYDTGKKVTSIRVTDGGSGYTTVPGVTVDAPASGTPASATAHIGGIIERIDITNPGSGYSASSPPNVTLTAGSGPVTDAVLEAKIARAGEVVKLDIASGGAGYPGPGTTITLAGGGGEYGVIEYVIKGRVGKIELEDAGEDYTSTPTVTITGDGDGASATAVVNPIYQTINNIKVDSGGQHYLSSNTTVEISGGGGTGAKAKPIIYGTILEVYLYGSRNYTSTPEVNISSTRGDAAVGAAINAYIGGIVESVRVKDAGEGYPDSASVTVNVDAPGGSGNLQAAADAVVSGVEQVVSVKVTDGGNGYVTEPDISIDPPGSGDTAKAISYIGVDPQGGIMSIDVTNGGSGYHSDSTTVSVTGDGVGASVEWVIEGVISDIVVENSGHGYDPSDPDNTEVIITGSGSGATATANVNVNSNISSITITDGGTGYSTEDTAVEIVDKRTNPTGTLGEARPVIRGSIREIRVTDGGRNYDEETTSVDISDSASSPGSGAEASANVEEVTSTLKDMGDVFTRQMIRHIHTFKRRNTEGVDDTAITGSAMELEPVYVDEEKQSEIRGDYLVERKVGNYYEYREGNDYHFHHPDNRRFIYGNDFRITHKDNNGDTASVVGDLVGSGTNYTPTGSLDYATNRPKAWDEVIAAARVTLAEHDTINGQKGNIYDFGGYWGYSLGNSYDEQFMNQKAAINADHDKDLCNKGGPDWDELDFNSYLSKYCQSKISLADIMVASASDWKKSGGATSVWVAKVKDGRSYDFDLSDSISVSQGHSLEITHGGRTSVEVKHDGSGNIRGWSRSKGEVTREKTWNKAGKLINESMSRKEPKKGLKWYKKETDYHPRDGTMKSFSQAYEGGAVKFDANFQPSFSTSLELAPAVTSIKLDFGQVATSLKISATTSLDFSFSAGAGFTFAIGASAYWVVEGHIGGTKTYNMVTQEWDGKFLGIRAQKRAAIASEMKTVKLEKGAGLLSQDEAKVAMGKIEAKMKKLKVNYIDLAFHM